jgi:hypothetical protein
MIIFLSLVLPRFKHMRHASVQLTEDRPPEDRIEITKKFPDDHPALRFIEIHDANGSVILYKWSADRFWAPGFLDRRLNTWMASALR